MTQKSKTTSQGTPKKGKVFMDKVQKILEDYNKELDKMNEDFMADLKKAQNKAIKRMEAKTREKENPEKVLKEGLKKA